MTALSETNRYRINGVIDTAKPVIENIENIANSAQSWFTYDNTTGKWGVIINQETASTYSFTDDNIVGSINVGTNGIDTLYNRVETNYPDNDLLDVNNTRSHTIPSGLQIAAEQPNLLKLGYNLISDQVQAQNLSRSEMWQTRTDLSITFSTNFTANEVAIGDVVDVTNNTYGWTTKLFRVTNIREEDTIDGDIAYSIMASEYRDDIYDHVSERETEDPADGINTIANIGALGTVTFTKDEVSDKPSITFNSTIPAAGSPVTAVQVWSYQITDPTELANWNNSVLYPDALRKYDLLFTRQPSEEDYFTTSQTFTARTENLGAGDYIFKLRPTNATTQGVFTPIQLVNYAPQVTQGVINDITDNSISFQDIPAIVTAREITTVPLITASGVGVGTTSLSTPLPNPSRGLLLTWDALFFTSATYDPATINQYQLTVTRKRSGQPDLLLTNEFGRTIQTGFAQGSDSTLGGITFFVPNSQGNGTFDVGDVFEFGVAAFSTGTTFSTNVSPTVRLEYLAA